MITEFSLFIFTLLGGLAAGAYAIACIFPPAEDKQPEKPWLLPLCALILLGISGIALMMHLGHPERVFNAFANPNAGITREGFATGLFGILVLVDFILAIKSGKPSPRGLTIAAGVAGVLLLIAIACAYLAFAGVPAWTDWSTFPLFVVGGLATGAAALPLFDKSLSQKKPFVLTVVVLNALFACTALLLGMHFSSLGMDMVPFIVAGAIAVGAAVVAYLSINKPEANYALIVCALTLIAVAVARYAFYAAF